MEVGGVYWEFGLGGAGVDVVLFEPVIVAVIVVWGFVVDGHSAEPAWEVLFLAGGTELFPHLPHVAGLSKCHVNLAVNV